MVIAVRSLPDLLKKDGSRVMNDQGAVCWKDLPDFTITFREYGICAQAPFLKSVRKRAADTGVLADIDDQEDNSMTDEEWVRQVTPLTNSTTFAATLLMRSSSDMGMASYRTTALARALEYPDIQEEWQAAAMWVRPAVTWISVAGGHLRRYCTSLLTSNSLNVVSGPLWDGGWHFSTERWLFWKRRFQELAADTASREDVRTYSASAASQMATVEIGDTEERQGTLTQRFEEAAF